MSGGEKNEGWFCAVGQFGLRMVSRDGADWQHIATGREGEIFRAVAFGEGRFVAVGSYGGGNVLATTTDGEKWLTAEKDGKYSKYFRGLSFGRKEFLAIGGDPGSVGASSPFVCTSADGQQWSDYQGIVGKHILRRVAFGNDLFVGVGDRGRRAASKDGLTWQDAAEVKAIDTLVDVAFGNGLFVGVGLHGLRMSSPDGLVWSERQLGEEGEHLNSIVFAEGRFVAVGAGATYFSADGKAWDRQPNQDAPTTVAYGNKIFLGSSWRGRILRSADAVKWQESFKSANHVESLAFGNLT